MAKSKITVKYRLNLGTMLGLHQDKTFNDWWDFADFVKQANLKGWHVDIRNWEYV